MGKKYIIYNQNHFDIIYFDKLVPFQTVFLHQRIDKVSPFCHLLS